MARLAGAMPIFSPGGRRPIKRPRQAGGGGGGGGGPEPGVNPAALFSAGELGLWIDPSDDAMFTFKSGTVVATVSDKSGRGNHMFLDASSIGVDRLTDEVGKKYLSFSGGAAPNGMLATVNNLPAGGGVNVFLAIMKNSDATRQNVLSLGDVSSDQNVFDVRAPGSNGTAGYGFRSIGTGSSGPATVTAGYAAGNKHVISATGNISTDTSILRVGGVQVASSANDQGGSSTYQNNTKKLTIGSVLIGGTPFIGRIYGAIVRFGTLTAQQIADTEAWLAGKM